MKLQREVVAVRFGEVLKMADFILDNHIENIETYTRTKTLIGFLTHTEIEIACNKYGGEKVPLPSKEKKY